jgi:hypothetical protein
MQLAVTFLQAGPKEHRSHLPTMSLKMQVFCISIRAVNLLILIGKSNYKEECTIGNWLKKSASR